MADDFRPVRRRVKGVIAELAGNEPFGTGIIDHDAVVESPPKRN